MRVEPWRILQIRPTALTVSGIYSFAKLNSWPTHGVLIMRLVSYLDGHKPRIAALRDGSLSISIVPIHRSRPR